MKNPIRKEETNGTPFNERRNIRETSAIGTTIEVNEMTAPIFEFFSEANFRSPSTDINSRKTIKTNESRKAMHAFAGVICRRIVKTETETARETDESANGRIIFSRICFL